MLSRARIFAAVTLLASCLAGPAAWAQAQNLEAGKSASQLFAGTCNACHKSPRGLLKSVSAGSLPGFLREHYTTSSDMASQLSSFLISNGASDARQGKQGADKPGGNEQADRQGRKNRNAPAEEATRPNDGLPPGEGGRQGRKRLAHPGDPTEEARPAATTPAQAVIERGPDGRRLKRPGRPGRPGTEEPSMANEPPKPEPSKTEPSKVESGMDDKAKGEPKEEIGNAERPKPDAEGKSGNEVKIEAPKDNASGEKPVLSRDPVPLMTPAPPAAASTPAPAPAVAGGSSEPTAPASQPLPAASPAEPPAVTASAPPPPPSPAGPPTPPISQ
jgi:hypothetical protein